jgi:hypothetical protein
MLEKAVRQASATENLLQPISRYDANISNGIIYTVKEQNITDLIIGLHQNANTKDFLGATANHIVKRVYETIFIYKSIQPLNTTKRIVVAVSPKAELEPGFAHWFFRLVTLAKETGTSLAFYATPQSIVELQSQQQSMADSVPITYHGFVNWDDFLILHSMLKPNDLFVIITSRKDSVSYHPILEKLPYYLVNYFKTTSYMIIYPQQLERGVNMENLEAADGSLAETISENVLRKPGNLIKKLFKK